MCPLTLYINKIIIMCIQMHICIVMYEHMYTHVHIDNYCVYFKCHNLINIYWLYKKYWSISWYSYFCNSHFKINFNFLKEKWLYPQITTCEKNLINHYYINFPDNLMLFFFKCSTTSVSNLNKIQNLVQRHYMKI